MENPTEKDPSNLIDLLVRQLARVPGVHGIEVSKSPLFIYYFVRPEHLEAALFLIGRCLDPRYGGGYWTNRTEITDLPECKVTFLLQVDAPEPVIRVANVPDDPEKPITITVKKAEPVTPLPEEKLISAIVRLTEQLELYLSPSMKHVRKHFNVPDDHELPIYGVYMLTDRSRLYLTELGFSDSFSYGQRFTYPEAAAKVAALQKVAPGDYRIGQYEPHSYKL